MVSVDFAWSGVIYVLEKNDIAEIVISNVKKNTHDWIFYSLLKFSNTWIPAIIDSFTKIGQTAGNVSASTASPDGLAGTGFELAMAAFKAIHDLGMLDSLAVIFPVTMVAIIILFIIFLFVAAQLFGNANRKLPGDWRRRDSAWFLAGLDGQPTLRQNICNTR
ncbi:type IV secretion system protein [Undibacterium arcticum]